MIEPELSAYWKETQREFLASIGPDHHFFRLFDDLPDIHFYAKNRKGETLFCSEGIQYHHGLESTHQMIGKTDQDLTPGALANKYDEDDRKIYKTGLPLPPTIEIWLDDVGLPEWYRSSKRPILDTNGNVIGIMGTLMPCGIASSERTAEAKLAPAIELLKSDLEVFSNTEKIAALCHLSVRQFQRVFKSSFGMSPKTYWIKLRIREACISLRQGNEPLVDICMRLGFCDQSSFSSQFKKHTGKTPKMYQKHAASRLLG